MPSSSRSRSQVTKQFDRFWQSSGRLRLSTSLWSLKLPMCPLWLIIGTTTTVDDLTVLRTPRGKWKNRGNAAPYGPHGRLSLNSLALMSTDIEESNPFWPSNVHVGVCHWVWRPMCLAPRCVPNKPVEFLSTRLYLADCTGVVQWSELFVSQIDSSIPAKSGCLKVNVVLLTDCPQAMS